MKALYGLEFAPIVSIASGFRNDPITGLDSNREHIYPFAARPAGFSRNSLATSVNVDVDFRMLKMVAIKGGHLDIVAEEQHGQLACHCDHRLVPGLLATLHAAPLAER